MRAVLSSNVSDEGVFIEAGGQWIISTILLDGHCTHGELNESNIPSFEAQILTQREVDSVK